MADTSNPSTEESTSDGDISIDSSGSEQEEEYTVEEILAERIIEGSQPLYLVKWEGYGEERCTWEPAESFFDPRSLQDWAKKRDAGNQLDDDHVNQINAKINAYLEGRAFRQAQRKGKHQRLATKPASSPVKTHRKSESLKGHGKQKSTVEKIPHLSLSRRRTSDPAQGKPFLATHESSIRSMPVDNHSGPTTQTTTPKQPVFHGISIGTAKNSGRYARRTGNQQASKKGSIRNLRHLNNVRKASRRERSPDMTKIKLRSLTDWAESAPEDTNLQLPPLPPPSTSLAESGGQAVLNASRSAPEITPTSGPADEVAHESVPNRRLAASRDNGRPSFSTRRNDMIATNRVDIYEGQEKILRTLATGRYFYFPGEFLTQVKFGKIPVGDVRIRGLPKWAIGPILKLRIGHLRLEIGAKDVVTVAQWYQLCIGRSNQLQTTGVLIPFEDTADTVSEMENYLHQNTFAALWYHPTEDIMLVFYSPRSSAWMFLERMGGLPFDGNIRVLTRNKMPSTEMLAVEKNASEDNSGSIPYEKSKTRLPQHKTQSFSTLDITDDFENSTLPPTSRSRRLSLSGAPDTADETLPSTGRRRMKSSSTDDVQVLRPLHDRSVVQHDIHDLVSHHLVGSDPNDSEVNSTAADPKPFQLRLQPGQTVMEAFQSCFQISYKHLTAVPASKNFDRDPKKARFYLVYPSTAQAELECLQDFLRPYTFHTNICTSMDERGWEAFQNLYKSDYVGVIIFHDDRTDYHTLPRLASLLRSSSLNVFRVSLSDILRGYDDPVHIERLFPSGLAVLMAESSLITHGLPLLRWFTKWKRPTWQIIMPPNIKNWLRHKALGSAAGVREKFNDMLQVVNKLRPDYSALRHRYRSDGSQSSDAESIDEVLSDTSSGFLVSPSCLPAYKRPPPSNEKWSEETWKDHVLVEYFAGWAVAHASLHRRFVAISAFPNKGYSKWGHIEVLLPDKFMQREGIGRDRQTDTSES